MFLINAKLVNTGNPLIFGDLQGEYGYTLPYVKRGFLKEYVKFTVLTCCVLFFVWQRKGKSASICKLQGGGIVTWLFFGVRVFWKKRNECNETLFVGTLVLIFASVLFTFFLTCRARFCVFGNFLFPRKQSSGFLVVKRDYAVADNFRFIVDIECFSEAESKYAVGCFRFCSSVNIFACRRRCLLIIQVAEK